MDLGAYHQRNEPHRRKDGLFAELPNDFSVHSLRHTTATMMAARGASPIRIKTWLRHKRVNSSERYFEQVKYSDTGKKMEGIFGDILLI